MVIGFEVKIPERTAQPIHLSYRWGNQSFQRERNLQVSKQYRTQISLKEGSYVLPQWLSLDITLQWPVETRYSQLLAPRPLKLTFVLNFHFGFFIRMHVFSSIILGTGIESLLA
jgi:hypothetical protein